MNIVVERYLFESHFRRDIAKRHEGIALIFQFPGVNFCPEIINVNVVAV